jgi:predicted transcriptional regulator
MDEEAVTLADLLRAGLRGAVVGIDPSPVSVAAGHNYQGQLGERSFAALSTAGLLPRGPGFRTTERTQPVSATAGSAGSVLRCLRDSPVAERACGWYAGILMMRTTVKLPDDLDARLRHEAQRRGTTIAEITRTALEAHLGAGGSRRRLGAAAAGRSGRSDISERVDEIIRAESASSR